MSVQYITKRSGERQKFDINKVLQWEMWGCADIKQYVDWKGVVLKVRSQFVDGMSTQDIQLKLIEEFGNRQTWYHSLVAGRLYAAYIGKKIHDYLYPTVKELHSKLVSLGYMREMGYTDEEYAEIEQLIDHTKNYQLNYIQVFQLVNKYSLTDRVNRKQFETPQFIFMRMAMDLSSDEPDRMKHVKKFYRYLSDFKINAPTPNYLNLGTNHKGYISCCLYTTSDTAESLAAGDHIAYTMTYMSAGIGGFINTRSYNDPVKNGAIRHMGKLPYLASAAAAVNANMQGGRGGSSTQYFSVYDPEVMDIVYLQNPRTPITKQNRDSHFAAQFNDFFVEKAFKGENIFTFNTYTANDLHKAMFSADGLKFKQLYAEKEADPSFKKNYINARELALTVFRQCHEVGTLYAFNSSEVNRHTPFKDPILQSNLCVAPETMVMTDMGYKCIRDLKDQQVNVWNGKRYSEVTVQKTSEGAKLLTVKTKFGFILSATEQHKWYVMDHKTVKEVRTNELKPGMQLVHWAKPVNTAAKPISFSTIYNSYQEALDFALSAQVGGFNVSIVKKDSFSFCVVPVDHLKRDEVSVVIDGGRYDETYCFTEPLEHRGVFNGILTGQCTEITQPTKPYENIMDLYSTEPHERGEISLCGLGGIIPSNVASDEEYEDVAYYTLLMIDKCIHKNHYVFPHLEYTAKSRMNAAVGMIGVAYDLAKRGLNYTSKAGLQYLHFMSERHSYYLIKAAVRLGAERGNAAWMHKTKWPEGWLPIDTYKKDVDEGMDFEYKYEWEELRKALVANKGMRFSSLVAHMPTESSSKTSGLPNGVYPVRAIYLKKTDGSAAIDYIVKDSDIIADQYDIAWRHTPQQQMRYYGVIQKFADQTTSADVYSDRTGSPGLNASRLLDELYWMYKYGVKTRYYTNSKTTKGVKLEDISQERGCSGGTCTL